MLTLVVQFAALNLLTTQWEPPGVLPVVSMAGMAVLMIFAAVYLLYSHKFNISYSNYPESQKGALQESSIRPCLRGGGPKESLDGSDHVLETCSDEEADMPFENLKAFRSEDWIGCGKVWDGTMPPHVEHAQNAACQIPSFFTTSLSLPQDASVSQLLAVYARFPAQIQEQPTFSSNKPTALLSDKCHQLFSAKQHIWASVASSSTLRTTFSDAWLSGARSISLPSDPLQWYPLWVEKVFAHLQAVHLNMYNTNISPSLPLNPGDFVLVLQSVDAAFVITMYTKSEGRGCKHAWTASVNSIGTPSSLDCPTFLNVPRTHVVLSIANYTKSIVTGGIHVGTHEVDTVMLCAASARLHLALTVRHDNISKAIKQLCVFASEAQRLLTTGSCGGAQAWVIAINEPRSTGDNSDDVISDDSESENA
ncbi:hypothetical protein BC835DRAFT_1310109 [Cytidiella melzeri]|nr:hypothetical protein BC835DRAFT_1310109 [Cytidiella melzeri]